MNNRLFIFFDEEVNDELVRTAMTRLVEDDVVEKLVVGMVFLMTGASFCNNVPEKEAEEEKKKAQYKKMLAESNNKPIN